MKKFVALTVVIVLLFTAIVGCGIDKPIKIPSRPAVQAVNPPANGAETDTAEAVKHPDYEKMYALYTPDTVVMTVDGRDVTWGEYFSWYYTNAKQVENYMQSMAMYGYPVNWDDMANSSASYASYVTVSTEGTIKQMQTIEGYAASNGIELGEESKAAIEEQIQSDIVTVCGEGATMDDLYAYLESVYMPVETYNRISSLGAYQMELVSALYGENNSKLSDKEVLEYLNDNGYMSAHHILFLTTGNENGEELTEEELAAKQAQAEAVYAELAAIENTDERLKRFGELKQELCEDTGKTMYPDGYTFTTGQMVSEFENAVLSLDEYEVSEPVRSSFGYHIIMRLPLDTDALIMTSTGEAATGRSLYASSDFNSRLQGYMDAMEMEYANGFEGVNILDYLSE